MTVHIKEIKNRESTLTERVMDEIRDRIDSHRQLPGTKLPSIRKFAEVMRVSKSTVVDAYDRLAAEGIIQARKGSGFYVTGHLPPLTLSKIGPRPERVVDPLWVSRQSLDAEDEVLKPGCGWLPADWMPQDAIRRALRTLSRSENPVLVEYGTPHGFTPLREFLVRRMANHGIEAGLDQVILTESGTQAIDLLFRFFIEPGDTVLVDDPCYFNFHAMLKAHRANVVSVPYTANGPDLDVFQKVLAESKPRLYITNSGVHNPTGASLSPAVAHHLLKLAEESDIVIIEDDIFSEFEDIPTPRLAAFDGLNQVVHIGSFSKTLSAASRCGYMAVRPDWVEGLIDLKIATSFGGGSFAAELAWRVLRDGSYRKHIDDLRVRLSQARGRASGRLKGIGINPWITPQAGMFLWCTLPGNLDAADVAKKALVKDIVLAPGNVFSLSGSANQFLRFNVTQCSSPRIFEVLQDIISG